MDRLRISLLCAAGATALTLAACSSAGSSSSPGPTGAQPSTGPAVTASASSSAGGPSGGGAGVVRAGGDDDGKTVSLRVGEQLHVDLPTPFWTYQPVGAPVILRVDATTWVKPPSSSCPPPMGIAGCGDQTADYTAVAPGHVTLVATREVCGEAARCTGNAGHWELHVTVTG